MSSYLCADSGNLMAIAQQLIQQQQKQQQLQSLQSPHQHPPWPGSHPDFPSFPDDLSFPDHVVTSAPFVPTDFDSDDWIINGLVDDDDHDDAHDVIIPPFHHHAAAIPPAAPTVADSLSAPTNLPPLLTSLLDCACLAESDPDLASETLTRIRELTSDVGDPTERVAFYFSEALLHRLKPKESIIPSSSSIDFSSEEFTACYQTLNDACPYSKFAHLTANQAILESTASSDRIHVIDFGVLHGVQWAALLQALSTRPPGKPAKIRISGVPAPALGDSPSDSLTATGTRLRDFALLLGLDFEFHPILTPLHSLTESTFRVQPDEALAVNFMLDDDSPELVRHLLRIARSLNPSIVTLGGYEASFSNQAGFVARFADALEYYWAVFESLEPAMDRDSSDRVRVERLLLGHGILRAVGPDERKREKWTVLMERWGGFRTAPLSNYAVSQAKLLLWSYNYSSKFTVLDSLTGSLSLAWEERPLLTISSWR